MAASSSTQAKKYDIFISFRGEDVRNKFLSHLLSALTGKGINAFKDENLRKGENISPALLDVIKESHVSIVIFSQNYPYSSWCLDELAQILECNKTMKQRVMPVFYDVDPSHVQDLQGNFKDALLNHTEKYSSEKVEIWSSALQEISGFSGFVSSTDKPESEFIDEIANSASKELNDTHPSDYEGVGLFGIDLHVRRVESLLCTESRDHMHIIGIWGMGGIGKTLIADKVYNKTKNNFDAHCFIANVRETLKKRAPHDLRDEIFRELLGDKSLFIGTPHTLEPSTKRRLQCKRIFIVLDDVDDFKQLRLLIGDHGMYSACSRIIVTSRDSQVLKNIGMKEYIYAVEGLSDIHALQLFSWYAFKQKHPREGYMTLSEKVIQYAKGLPLALIVLGSNLHDRRIKDWNDALEKLQSIPNMDVQNILRISYDGLESNEKRIFLDIACFFKGYKRDWVEGMLKSFGFFPKSGMRCLCDKSLISYDQFSNITMHDLVEQMGKEIIVQENNRMHGEQSRLWTSKDIIHVLRNNLGTAKIEGISLHWDEIGGEVQINNKAFKYMYNLRFLKISSEIAILLPNGLKTLPTNLIYLMWDRYPLNYLPPNFCPENLVELHMRHSQLKELQNLDKSLKSLKRIDLSYSRDLIRIPDFAKALNLEIFELEGCSSLVEISWCIQARSRRTRLDLSGCTSLRRLLEIPRNIEELILNETAIEQLPSEIGSSEKLRELHLRGCSHLASLPDTICHLSSLEVLDVSNCSNLRHLPADLGDLRNLQFLCAAKSGIQKLPFSINRLMQLIELNCSACEGLEESNPVVPRPRRGVTYLTPLEGLRNLYKGLRNLYKIDLSNCHLLKYPSVLHSAVSLEELYLGGNDFKGIPSNIYLLSKLRCINLRDCKRLEYLRELPPSLEFLEATNCTSLKSLETSVLPRSYLGLSNCTSLSEEAFPYGSFSGHLGLRQEASAVVNCVLENHQSLESKSTRCSSCVPGTEVPQRMMMCKSDSGPCLSITIDSDHLIGFSLCAVVASNSRQLRNIKCSAQFTDMHGCNKHVDIYFLDGDTNQLLLECRSENLFLMKIDCRSFRIHRVIKASFKFYIVYDGNEEDEAQIAKCACLPIFDVDDNNDNDKEEEQQPIQVFEDQGQGLSLINKKRKSRQ